MNEILRILLFIISISLLTACDFGNNKVDKISESVKTIGGPAKTCEEYSSPLNIVDRTDTLKILVQFSDCGEWGGHKESIYLIRNKENKIYARFIMDSVPCDKIIEKSGIGLLDDKTRRIVLDTTKLLNLEDEKLVSLFLQRLLELYLKNEVHANAGTVFHILNSDSSLNFTYWNSGDCRDTFYEKVRKQLFGDILKIK